LYPSYTADLWKSKCARYFCSVGFHWIDKDWVLHSRLTHCKRVNGDHSGNETKAYLLTTVGKNIGQLVANCLVHCLGENITPFSGVTDGGEIASVVETAR
jgi:hypothetical protein